jgi:hypothetical protein
LPGNVDGYSWRGLPNSSEVMYAKSFNDRSSSQGWGRL